MGIRIKPTAHVDEKRIQKLSELKSIIRKASKLCELKSIVQKASYTNENGHANENGHINEEDKINEEFYLFLSEISLFIDKEIYPLLSEISTFIDGISKNETFLQTIKCFSMFS